jgi:hypothetical protein
VPVNRGDEIAGKHDYDASSHILSRWERRGPAGGPLTPKHRAQPCAWVSTAPPENATDN